MTAVAASTPTPDLGYPLATLRSSLQGLSHELYFKSTHFWKLGGRVNRADHDAAEKFFADDPSVVIGGEVDSFTKLLRDTLTRVVPDLGASESDERIERWERAESTLNARVRLIFGLLGAQGAAVLLRELVTPLGDVSPLALFHGRNPVGGKRADGRLGQPDIILLGEGVMVSIEMKVRGGSVRAMYSADQHLKYLRLASEMREKEDGRLRTAHMLLAPLAGRSIVEDAGTWLSTDVRDGEALQLNEVGFLAALPPNRAAQAAELGGLPWVTSNQLLMPTRFLDLSRFLSAAEGLVPLESAVASELKRQLRTVRQYGVRP